MKYFTLLRANIKSQKGSFIGILTLVFMITISLLTVLSIWTNANAYEAERIESVGYGDISYWMIHVSGVEELLRQINELEEVERADVSDMIYFEGYEVRGENKETAVSDNSLYMLEWKEQENPYHIYKEDFTREEEITGGLSEGEIYVSPAFCSLHGAGIGDVIAVWPVGGEEEVSFTIKGYFEDPVAGSALMGMKQALITQTDKNKLAARIEDAKEQAAGQKWSVFHLTKNPDTGLSEAEFQILLSEKSDLAGAAGFSYTKSTIMGFMLILENIFAGFLIVFVMALLVVAIIIIGHSISSSIEQDYVDMGILKAVGYTQTDLRMVQILQYLAAVLGGMLPGIPFSIVVVRGINRLTVTVVGLFVPAALPAVPAILALLFILSVIMVFVYAKTAKIGRITPIRAIRGGVEDVYFKSRLSAPVHQHALSFWLACRQLVSGKKQYFSACLVTALLVFFLSLIVRMDAWLGPDGKGLMDSFAASRYDLGITDADEGILEEVEDLLDSRAGIEDSYLFTMQRASVNQVEYLMNVISEPEYFNILEGRTCLYQNELVMTQTVAEQLGVGIGDTVSLRYQESELDFIITGIYQCANDMGANFGINKEGYERFGKEEEEFLFWRFYLLKDPLMVQEMIETLNENYGKELKVDENTWSGIESIVAVTSSLTVFMFVITIAFILITVMLTGSKILYREQHDLGIYKSLGFVSERLRLSFALRFVIVAAAGSVLGIVMSACLTDPLASAILKFCGVSHFSSSLTLLRMLIPGIFVSILFFVFAYLAAGKIKKVEPGILITE